MVYVDLNPIRAGLADTPEDSDFTSIQERIRAWKEEAMMAAAVQDEKGEAIPFRLQGVQSPEPVVVTPRSTDKALMFLCPIHSDSEHRGILDLTLDQYIDLVDRSGRMIRVNKRGAIDPDLAPILMRIGARTEEWTDTVSRFGAKFQVAAGLIANLRRFADRMGRRWIKGIGTARVAFAS